ncbi:LysR family transcriptional regulator [Marinobacterium lutimaris]|uniref:Transcriptional regulator, LysR family n=1 Tax=Marinobacterium lutimaris TaxID=568106 RepID=A0A1H6CQB5_9GAMM|nr:LysR family transcriptional regulator [Marinobacterium lutimaris]SEG75172.1 transcriptional regulator, LysR family [Marinobacterium lutimaris]
MLTLKQLEAFVHIVELGTFELAAKRLNATQSTISKRITELEEASGLRLFDRSKRTARLTADGEKLLQLARDTLNSANRILQMKDDASAGKQRVRVGFTDLCALTWLPQFFRECSETYPLINLEITIDMSRNLYRKFEDGDLDIVVAPLDSILLKQNNHRYQVLRNVEIAFIGRSEFVSSPNKIPIHNLDKYNILVQGKESSYAQGINEWLSERGATLVPTMIANNLVALVGLISAGYGIGVLPKRFVMNLSKPTDLVEIKTHPELPDMTYYLLTRDYAGNEAIEKILEEILRFADFTTPFLH